MEGFPYRILNHKGILPFKMIGYFEESVNLSRTVNIMTKRKRTKGQTTIYKTLHIKLKIE